MDKDSLQIPASVQKDIGRQGCPADLAAAVGRILAQRVGQPWAIRRPELLQLIRQRPEYKRVTDTALRKAIETLRGDGWLVCNLMDDSGYFIASNPDEYRQARAVYSAYVYTMARILKQMDKTAAARWGSNALQEKLF